jgi:hypothetical protein
LFFPILSHTLHLLPCLAFPLIFYKITRGLSLSLFIHLPAPQISTPVIMRDSTNALYNNSKTLTSMFGAVARHILILLKADFPLIITCYLFLPFTPAVQYHTKVSSIICKCSASTTYLQPVNTRITSWRHRYTPRNAWSNAFRQVVLLDRFFSTILWCSEAELLSKTFYRFSGTLRQRLLNTVNVFWCSDRLLLTDNTLLIVAHAPVASNLLTKLFIADLLGAFLHSNFSRNSRWTVKILAVC